jgi:hypothetical protein
MREGIGVKGRADGGEGSVVRVWVVLAHGVEGLGDLMERGEEVVVWWRGLERALLERGLEDREGVGRIQVGNLLLLMLEIL